MMPPLKPGDRIELVHTDDAYTSLRPGAEGTVVRVNEFGGSADVDVRWDDGSRLSMIEAAGDRVRKIEDGEP